MSDSLIAFECDENDGEQAAFKVMRADGSLVHFERSDKREGIIKLENLPGLDETPEPFNEETVRLFEEEWKSWSE